MDKYEYKLKTEQMLELMEDGAYSRAAELADSIDWRRVRNTTMLMNVSDIYEKSRDYHKSFEVLKIAYHRAEGSRKIVYRLCTLALKTRNVDEAIDYYDEFLQIAPKDPNQYILKYQILKVQRAPIEQQIDALESFKKAEYVEEWAYELARLYERAGKITECLEECDDLILWFSEGKYVYQAMELKMRYKPLTQSQQEKYNKRYEKAGSVTEELPNLNVVDEEGVKIADKPEKQEELPQEEETPTEEDTENTQSTITIPVIEETLANKFVDEDVVKAEVRAKAKAEFLGDVESFEPTPIDSLVGAIKRETESQATETVPQEITEELETEKTEPNVDIHTDMAMNPEEEQPKEEVRTEEETQAEETAVETDTTTKESGKKKLGNTMRLDEALKALLHLDRGTEDTADSEEKPTVEDDLSDLNEAIGDIEAVADLKLAQEVAQKRAQREALAAVKDVEVDSDLEELGVAKSAVKVDTDVADEEQEDIIEEVDDPEKDEKASLADTIEMSRAELAAMYGLPEEDEEVIEEELEEVEEVIEQEPEEDEEIIEEEPIKDEEIIEVEHALEERCVDLEEDEEDELDNQVTARMSLEELFAAWDEEDALAEAEELVEEESEEIIEEEPEEVEEIIQEEPEEIEEIIKEEPEESTIDEAEAEAISEEELLSFDTAEEWSDDVEETSDDTEEAVEEIDNLLDDTTVENDMMQAEPEKEETMSVERKTGEPILPPDIQRLIDEIEGVIPREDEEPTMSESSTSASEMQGRMCEDNMEQETEMLRMDGDFDDIEDSYEDELELDERDSLEAVQPEGGYTQEFERIMDDRFASFEAEEDYSDELGDLYPDMEDDIDEDVEAIALEEEAFEQEEIPSVEEALIPDEYEDDSEDEYNAEYDD